MAANVTLHVTSFTGSVFQYERVITTAYALSYAHLMAIDALERGESIDEAMQVELERVGMIKDGVLTELGREVMKV